ncbi:MAG: hypothetical protein Q9217_002571 [Psora testacea]
MFVDNLERLGRMDKLGGAQVNCFDAVNGIYKGLETVHVREVEDERKKQQARFREAVMCSRSGEPALHTKRRVGLSLQYWMDQRHLSEDPDIYGAMEMDGPGKPEFLGDQDKPTWSAVIECEACPADLYTPLRLSENWVQAHDEKSATPDGDPMHISKTNLHWSEPPADIQLPSAATISDNKSPDVRFVAKLEPPVIVPLQVALNLQESLGSPIPQDTIMPTTYESLLFADVDGNISVQTSAPRGCEKMINVYESGTDVPRPHHHKYTLYTPQYFARSVGDLPFRHPMQIVNILPTLRQWALIGSILRRSFVPQPKDSAGKVTVTTDDTPMNGHAKDSPSRSFQSLEEELADFLSSPLPNDPSSKEICDQTRAIDISFTASPIPQFQIRFPNSQHDGKLASVQFNVGLNGAIEAVVIDDGRPPTDDAEGGEAVKQRMRLREKVRMVLEVGEDIGMLVEWICKAPMMCN